MKAGVSTLPWGSVRRPSRAAPSLREHAQSAAARRAHDRRPPRRLRVRARKHQHGIAVAEEAVALAHRVRVGREHQLAAGERRHQHQQRRLRQMEVGQQRIDHPEAIARADEQRRLARHRPSTAASSRPPARPTRARAPPWCRPRPRDRPRARARSIAAAVAAPTLVALGVHQVLLERLGAQRLEGARAHMQRDARRARCPRGQRRQQRRIEMQAGGRRGDRARYARPEALVALAVAIAGRPLDIGRQRHLAVPLEEGRPPAAAVPPPRTAPCRAMQSRPGRRRSAAPCRARTALLSRSCTSARRSPERALEQQLDAPAGGLARRQPRRQHARIVEHQQIARPAAAAAARACCASRQRPCSASSSSSRLAERTRQRRLRDQLRAAARSRNQCVSARS